MNRKNYLDILRGIAIFFVVFGHVTHISVLRTYIFGFHIPLFFFISGLLFVPEKYGDFKQFFVKKFKSLMIPYCFFYLVTFLYWLLIERKIRGGVSPGSQLLGMFYGTYNMKYMLFNGALWFLPCLFTTEILYFWINKICSVWCKLLVLLLIYILGISLISFDITWFPWGGNAALLACVFYGLGYCLKNKAFQLEKLSWFHCALIIIICGILQILLIDFTDADLASLNINYYSYIPVALIGIALYFSLSLIIKKNKFLEFLGINSLVIFAFQEQTYRVVIFIFSKMLNWEAEMVRSDLWICISISVITILLIIPLIFGYNKFVKPLLK